MDQIKNSCKRSFISDGKQYTFYDINLLQDILAEDIQRLPYSCKILLEGALRNYDNKRVTLEHIRRIATLSDERKDEIPFIPTRIVLQDFTGVPAVVDLAAMRMKMHEMGGDASKINPIVPVDLVIDHSVMVDYYGNSDALNKNVTLEFERNTERYELLKWAQNSFSDFRVFPPSLGIIHQINLEYLAKVAAVKTMGEETIIFPDTLVGTDSHTTMINGIGVLGWGVGGIEAEACMLGHPMYFLMPEVIGVRLTGALPTGTTATDLVLTITNMLRKEGVVGKFIEFFGDGVSSISVEDRATISNMCPEYGATCAYFPVDDRTLDYLRATGRSEEQILLTKNYYKLQGMFRSENVENPIFTKELALELSTIEPCIAGPKKPQDYIPLKKLKENFNRLLGTPLSQGGYQLKEEKQKEEVTVTYDDGQTEVLKTGAVVIAAITSCTNTSNPYVIMGAGLLAKKAATLGLKKPRYVKSSLGPGSLVVTEYLKASGLLPYLEELGFYVTGYGCTTCIGNSGPLTEEITNTIKSNHMTVAAVLSGNRNFEGRIHPLTKMNYLMSPMLVVAFGLAGTINIDFDTEPIGLGYNNEPVFLQDIWPDSQEIEELIRCHVKPELYKDKYRNIFHENELWNALPVAGESIYQWKEDSSYIKLPPFFDQMSKERKQITDIRGANVLAVFGDSVTTDHISPAGSIPESSDAGIHLTSQNIKPQHFNSYGSRRGSHEVMMRGTFANIRIRNLMLPGVEGGFTKHIPSDQVMTIYQAGMKYREADTPLLVIAGKEYGTGSSRDWAAKGTALLGVKAVLAESFERIHRSNLVGMGVLPLQFPKGEDATSLGITGNETFDIIGISEQLYPNKILKVIITAPEGKKSEFDVIARLDSAIDVEYYLHGGILNMILRDFLNNRN